MAKGRYEGMPAWSGQRKGWRGRKKEDGWMADGWLIGSAVLPDFVVLVRSTLVGWSAVV